MTQSDIVYNSTLRHDFVLLFDVTDGNPNGDPEAGNQPRTDPYTGQGMVSDGAIKRKIRDYIHLHFGAGERNKIYIQAESDALNTKNARAYTALGIKTTGTKQKPEEIEMTRRWMCDNFYDIRMFGAVMSTGVNCGQVTGPAQVHLARSIDPVTLITTVITRVAVTREEDKQVVAGDARAGKQTEMGSKTFVPYGLYRAHGFFTPHQAKKTGATDQDLAMLWKAMVNMWNNDHSAARGVMSCRGLHIFSHHSSDGEYPHHKLFEGIQIERRGDIAMARQFSDYDITVRTSRVQGVSYTVLGD